MPVILAKVRVKEGMASQFEQAGRKMVEAVRDNEPGCALYMLSRENDDSAAYVFIERYEDAAALQAHMQAPHMKTIGRELFACMEGPPEITQLAEV